MTPNAIECAFTGRVGKDIELRTSKAGKPWCSFTVAVGADDAAQWVRVALFGEKGEEAARTIAKGDRVYIEGRLKLATWEKDGEARAGLDVTAWLAQAVGKIGNKKPATPRESVAATKHGAGGAARDWHRPIHDSASASPDDPMPF